MNPEQKLTGLLNTAIQNQYGLAAWLLPGDQNLNLINVPKNNIFVYSNPDDVSGQSGFIFAPFQTNEFAKPVFLKSSSVVQKFENISMQKHVELNLPAPGKEIINTLSREQYLEKCNAVIREIKSGIADKVVFSRVIQHTPKHKKHPARILFNMKSRYPFAFCYLFYTPQSGLWMGATPETLLTATAGEFKTMALAGTRPLSKPENKPLPWPEKETNEQKFVSDYIYKVLSGLGIPDIKISKPYTATAGKIEHIRTDFVITRSGSGVTTGEVINALHPTPAICGVPRKAALEIINKTEDHRRTYYTGYLGPVCNDSESRLFVNLRCMNIHKAGFAIFAGGGITAASDAGLEWEETEMKASVMKNVIGTD